jgi:hypothetical protein
MNRGLGMAAAMDPGGLSIVSSSARPPLPHESNDRASTATPRLPASNPSYPPRTHFEERQALAGKLRSCDERIAAFERKLSVLAAGPDRASHERLIHQMHGARDQIAECLRRMPLETGILYVEDAERLRNAESALACLVRLWDGEKP